MHSTKKFVTFLPLSRISGINNPCHCENEIFQYFTFSLEIAIIWVFTEKIHLNPLWDVNGKCSTHKTWMLWKKPMWIIKECKQQNDNWCLPVKSFSFTLSYKIWNIRCSLQYEKLKCDIKIYASNYMSRSFFFKFSVYLYLSHYIEYVQVS